MKQIITKKGLWQSVQDNQINLAKEKVNNDLQLMTINDFYKGRKIEAVTFEETLPLFVRESLCTNQAVLFHLSKN